MASRLTLLLLGLALLSTLAHGHGERDYRRALDILRQLRTWATEGKRGVFDCKKRREACDGVVPCCDEDQCYWKDGYSAFNKGICVKCVGWGNKCQRDSQCCAHHQCDKGNGAWTDGTCEKYRRTGDCYRDGQCVNDCIKKWYQTHGKCS